MLARPHDTTTDAWLVQRSILGRMSEEGRIRVAIDLSETVRAIQLAGIMARNPGWSRVEAVHHLVRQQFRVDLPGRP